MANAKRAAPRFDADAAIDASMGFQATVDSAANLTGAQFGRIVRPDVNGSGQEVGDPVLLQTRPMFIQPPLDIKNGQWRTSRVLPGRCLAGSQTKGSRVARAMDVLIDPLLAALQRSGQRVDPDKIGETADQVARLGKIDHRQPVGLGQAE